MNLQEDRTAVQTLLGINLVIEAGAGTGKTTLLIHRLCLAILAQGIPVEKLVALTFTEKAAAEIKTRLIVMLQSVIKMVKEESSNDILKSLQTHFRDEDRKKKTESEKEKNEKIVQRAEAALSRLDRASIGTIHGFCAEILKFFPLEAGLSPNMQIDDGKQGDLLFEARWNLFLDEELGVSAPKERADKWKEVLNWIRLEELKDFARKFCNGKTENYAYDSHISQLIESCKEHITRAKELAVAFVPNPDKPRAIEKIIMEAARSLERTVLFLEKKEVPSVEQEFVFPKSKPTQSKGWEDADYEEAIALCKFAAKITPEKQRIFQMAYQLLLPLCQTVRQDFREVGLVSFDDLIIKTRNLLQQNLKVRRLLKEKFDVLFVDEFQDTDPVQGELLLFLAEQKDKFAACWKEVQLMPGKLIVVGDPKQSIYRFRGADITAYELFTNLILEQGGKKCFLQENFRSQPEIIDTANMICSKAMISQPSFQPQYVPIFTSKTSRNSAVEWLFISSGEEKLKAEDFRYNQAEQIARWIKDHVGKLELANGQKLEYKDISLLLRAGTYISFYTAALRRYGIAFNVDTDKDFFHKQEIDDLLNLLQVVANPSDRIALTGVLRSPLGGLTDEELYQLAKRGELTLAVTPSFPKAAACYQLVRHFVQAAERLSVKELVQQILDETFLPEACALAYEGERTLGYLKQLIKMVERYGAKDNSSAASFFERIKKEVQKNPNFLNVSLADESANGVSILTIHKSKGLEAPVVIVADLTKEDSSNVDEPMHIFSWQYNMHGLRIGKICDLNMAYLEEEQKKHAKCEEVRVLYVALTRAKEKLILVGDAREDASKNSVAFIQAGLFPDIEQKNAFVQNDVLKIPVTYFAGQQPDLFRHQHHDNKQSNAFELDIDAWKKSCVQREEKYQLMLLQAGKNNPSALNETNLLTEEQRAGAELGTLCHEVLEKVLGQKMPLEKAVETVAIRMGISNRSAEAVAILSPFVKSPLFQEIADCELLACEMPFSCLQKNGMVLSGLIDALVRRKDGKLWIIDYKTDKIKPGQENSVLEEKYQAQLSAYKEAVRRIFGSEEVKCSVVFIRTFAAAEL